MKNLKSLFALVLTVALFACNSSTSENQVETKVIPLEKMNIESLNQEIAKREAAFNNDSAASNAQLAAKLMDAYATYAERFPNYEGAAERLFKAGEIAMGLGHKIDAIKFFDGVYNEYPDYEKRPYALFMKAFVLENQAAEYDQAKAIYEEFIEKYPDHPMADDAEYSIANMGKSPEELIREFEKRDSLEKAAKGA